MLSIFTIPKAFVGLTGQIQRNAIKSWLHLKPQCEIILLGNDEGVEETAHALRISHILSIERNEFGTPLLSSAFHVVQQVAKNDIIMYVNSDIIFFQQLIEEIRTIHLSRFLLCGRRWDLDIQHEIDFSRATWVDELFQKLSTEGKLHGTSGIDYFVFRRGSLNMLPFAVGRPGWDNWLIYQMRRKKIPVIDASEAIKAIHQNHDFSHSKFGEKNRVGGPEYEKNIRIAGGLTNMMTLRDADWFLTKDGPQRLPFPRRIWSLLSLWYPWRVLVAAKRMLDF